MKIKLIHKILNKKWALRYIIQSIYFNFHYLPFRQAIHLPILLYRPVFRELRGTILISGGVSTGMINIGRYRVSVYPNSGCIFDIHGGQICFNGNCDIGNASSISIGKNAKVKFGKNFNATAALKLICYNKIEFGDNTLIGWDCLFMDTDFHKIKHLKENDKGHIPYGTIKIGNNCWFALKNIILKNTTLPDNIIVSANSLLNKQYDISPFSLIAGSPAKFIRGDVYRDPEDDVIEYNI